MGKTNVSAPRAGQRVAATREISWTVGQFEAYPLIISPGDLGTIVKVDWVLGAIYIEWDTDPFKQVRRAVSMCTPFYRWPIRIIN